MSHAHSVQDQRGQSQGGQSQGGQSQGGQSQGGPSCVAGSPMRVAGLRTLLRALAVAAVGLLASRGGAYGQEALYGKQPPHGSAFVRFVNATPGPVTITSDFEQDVHLGTAAADRVAQYAVVERAADRTLHASAGADGGSGRLEYQAPADGYVTILLERGAGGELTFVPIVDQAEFNQTRARLAFYNAAPTCSSASLVLDPGGAAVFQGVVNGSTKSRTVNPVQATVRAACTDGPGPTLSLAGMELGASYSIWLIQPGAAATLFLTQDSTARYKPQG